MQKPKERLEEESRGKKRRNAGEGEGEGEEEEVDENEEPMEEAEDAEVVVKRTTKRREAATDAADAPDDFPAKRARQETPAISVDRYAEFKRHLRGVFDEAASGAESLPLDNVVAGVQRKAGAGGFSQGEVSAALERLGDDNVSMVCDGNLVLI